MPRFEVSCPAAPPALPDDATVRVEAEHWLAALKAGLEKAGRPALGGNVLCDIQGDGSILVTAPAGDAVFRVRELRPERAAATPVPHVPPLPREAGERAGPRGAARSAADVLAALFERVTELSRHRDRKGGLGFLLDLALEEVGAEAGSVFVSRLATRVLEFAVARGPRADELLALGTTVPVGVGIVGFCAQENVAVAVRDAERDPRFHAAISRAIGYPTRSLLCAPIARQGRVLGAIELINKRGGAPFDETDLAVVSYLAHQAAAFLDRTGE